MKLKMECNYLSGETIIGKKDPTKTYYNVAVIQGAEPIKLNTSEEVFNKLQKHKVMDSIIAIVEYNPQYKSIRLESIE